MKKRNLLLIMLLVFNLFGQLKVDSIGKVIIGSPVTNLTESNLTYGNTRMVSTTNNASNFAYFQVNNGAPGLDVGTNGLGVAFYLGGSYKNIYASKLCKLSDSILKFNHFEIQNPLAKLQSLYPYVYNMYSVDENQVVTMNSEYGFFSQDVESALPEVDITENVHDYKLLDYDQIIPLIVAAMKEQQLQIDSLQAIILNCCQTGSERVSVNQSLTRIQKSIITNITPNPSDGKFIVNFQLSSEYKNVAFEIVDVSGKQMFYIKLNSNEIFNRSVEINLGSLNEGVYQIALFTDGIRSDLKKILKQ